MYPTTKRHSTIGPHSRILHRILTVLTWLMLLVLIVLPVCTICIYDTTRIWYTYLVNAADAFLVVSLKICWSSSEEKTVLERLDVHMEQCLGLFPEAICIKTL